ncbi:MAG: type III secretion system export apparatus subunit SctT [Pseudomonadota bacterium]
MLEVFRYVLVLGMMMARAFGIAIILPVFTRAQIGNPVRAGFAIAIMLPILPAAREGFVGPAQFDNLELTALAAKEFIIGVVLGLLLSFPFWAIQTTGEYIDSQRGITNADFEEPGGQGQTGVISNLLAVVTITLFVSADGLRLVADIVYKSYESWPLLVFFPSFDDGVFDLISKSLDYIFTVGFVIAGPFILIFFLTDFSVAAVGRFSPKIATADVSSTIKNFLFCILLLLYTLFFVEYLALEVASLHLLSQKIGFE